MKVLLVEDHDDLAKISCTLLEKRYRHKVQRAKTAQEAYEMALLNVPDIILLDLNLPDKHGYRLAEMLRAESKLDQTVLVALTGYGLTGDSGQSKAVGIDAHYRKPMDFGELPQIKRSRPVAPADR